MRLLVGLSFVLKLLILGIMSLSISSELRSLDARVS